MVKKHALLGTKKEVETIVRFGNLANHMNECLWVGDKNHKTIYVNPVFEKISGFSFDECIGRDCASFFDRIGKKEIERQHKLRKAGKSTQYEATLISKYGETVPLWISGAPTDDGGTIGIFTDLRKIRELENQERIFTQIIKNSTEALVILDDLRRIQMWSDGAKKMFGYKEKEVIGQIVDILIPPSEQPHNTQLIWEVEKKNYIKNAEAKRKTKSGDIIEVSLSVSKVLDGKNFLVGFLVIYRDLTVIKRSTEELQKRFEAIQDAYKELGLQKREADYMHEIAEKALSNEPVDSLYKIILSAGLMLTKCDAVVIRTFDPSKKILKLQAHIGVDQNWHTKDQIEFKNSLAEEAFQNKRPLIITNIDPKSKHRSVNLVKSHKFTTLILIPLMVKNRLLGTISLYAIDPGKFRLIETEFLEFFGKQSSTAIFTKLHS